MKNVYPENERLYYYLPELETIEFEFKHVIFHNNIDLNKAGKTCSYQAALGESEDGTEVVYGLMNNITIDEDIQLLKFKNTDFDPNTLRIYDGALPEYSSDSFLQIKTKYVDIQNETSYEGFTRKFDE